MAVRGVLLDIDGVLTVSWEPLPGAADALAELSRCEIPFRLVTRRFPPRRTTWPSTTRMRECSW